MLEIICFVLWRMRLSCNWIDNFWKLWRNKSCETIFCDWWRKQAISVSRRYNYYNLITFKWSELAACQTLMNILHYPIWLMNHNCLPQWNLWEKSWKRKWRVFFFFFNVSDERKNFWRTKLIWKSIDRYRSYKN